MEFKRFKEWNIAKKSSIVCVNGVPQPNSAMAFTKK